MITFWQQILIYLPLSSREGICYPLTVPHGGKSFIVTSSWESGGGKADRSIQFH